MAITPERVSQILQELEWPIQSEPDTFEFFPDKLGLTETEAAQVRSVRQVVNFDKGQP